MAGPTSHPLRRHASRAAQPAAPASRSTTARCSRRWTTASSATRCRRSGSRRRARPRSSSPGCRSPAIIPCTRSRSMPRRPVRQLRLRHQRLPGREPHRLLPGASAMHRAGDAGGHLALRCQPHGAAVLAGRAFCHRDPQCRRHCGRRERPRALRDPARPRPAARELAEAVHARSRAPTCPRRSCCGSSRAPTTAGRSAISTTPRKAGARAGVRRRRRQEGRHLRRQEAADRGLPRSLGAQRPPPLRRRSVPGRLPGRRVHRLPWLVEPRPVAAGRLQRGVPAAGGRQAFRGLRGLRRWLRRRREGAGRGRASAGRACGRTRRRALHRGRRARPHLAGHLPRRRRHGHRAGPRLRPAADIGCCSSREPPEGIHPDAGAEEAGALPTPPGATAAQVALGDRVFHGEAGGGTCAGCHGSNAEGTPLGPGLTSGQWLGRRQPSGDHPDHHRWRPNPKEYRSPMPPMGGAQLSPAEVAAVSAYVWALGHRGDVSPFRREFDGAAAPAGGRAGTTAGLAATGTMVAGTTGL